VIGQPGSDATDATPPVASAGVGVEAVPALLTRVVATLRAAGIRFAVAGGCAVYARGGSPTENDVDVFVREQDVEAAAAALVAAGLRAVPPPEDWLTKVTDGELTVDLIFRPNEQPVTDEVLDAAETMRVGPMIAPVISGTELMVSKILVLHAHRCDLTGLLATSRELREQVGWREVAERTRTSPYARALLGLLADLGVVDPADVRPAHADGRDPGPRDGDGRAVQSP
jgi:hypothetical protein